MPLRAQPAEHVWQSRPSYPSAHCAWRKASALSKSTSLSSARARVRFGLMLKNISEGLLSLLMFVLAASVDRCCRLPSQAAFESHSSILRHASEVTRPVCASFLQRSAESHSCRTTYSSGHERFPECAPVKRSVPGVSSGPAPLRLPMPWLGDDDVLSRAEATARWAWCALLAAAAEDVRAILAGEALACKWRCTRPRGPCIRPGRV